jgi:hypothetical protein
LIHIVLIQFTKKSFFKKIFNFSAKLIKLIKIIVFKNKDNLGVNDPYNLSFSGDDGGIKNKKLLKVKKDFIENKYKIIYIYMFPILSILWKTIFIKIFVSKTLFKYKILAFLFRNNLL